MAEHYERVIGTDISQAQLKLAKLHPRVQYIHTPLSLSDDELIKLIGGENSVDLVTVAQAVHWFDLPKFYSIINRVLRKPNGVFAVWGYGEFVITTEIDAAIKRFRYTTALPYWKENVKHIFEGFKTLPFPFESVGLGTEGMPLKLDIPRQLSFDGVLGILRSWSAVATAKEKGVDLLSESVVQELENLWGKPKLAKRVVFKGFILVGRPRP